MKNYINKGFLLYSTKVCYFIFLLIKYEIAKKNAFLYNNRNYNMHKETKRFYVVGMPLCATIVSNFFYPSH